MNTKPDAKVVLCYGDSNTWGRNPADHLRYNSSQRWTGKLQQNLGSNYYVIEEGLGGRTTDMDDARRSYRNGYAYFEPCIESHQPDVVVLMLGTNDLKDVFNKTAQQIGASIEKYCAHLVKSYEDMHIILIAPTGVDRFAPNFGMYASYFSALAAEKGEQLVSVFRQISQDYNTEFIDASELVILGEEGLHWSVESHAKFAEVLAEKIQGLNL